MRCTAFRFTTIGLVSALAIAGLEAGSVRAKQPDATTIAIAVAQGNAQCLIKTGTMKPEQAQSIADGSWLKKRSVPRPATR